MNVSPKVLHLIAVVGGVLVYLSTDQEFISMLTVAQQHWLHIAVGVLVYLGVSQVNRTTDAVAPQSGPGK